MRRYRFIGTDKNYPSDRDAFIYIDVSYTSPMRTAHGACYCKTMPEYKDIDTPLSEEEWKHLWELSNQSLGTTEKYMELIRFIDEFEQREEVKQIFEDEKEFIKDEFGLSDGDLEDIFNEYGLDYRDRGIIDTVFSSYEEYGAEEADAFELIPNGYEAVFSLCFDFEKFGKLLKQDYGSVELDDGRIVTLNY